MNNTAPRLRPFASPFGPAPTRKAEMQRAKVEVGEILSRLGKCCRPTSEDFQWPEESDLKRLDDIVFEASLWLRPLPRKQKPRRSKPWPRYCAVDHHWPNLLLCERIKKLLVRARDNAPQRPLEMLWRVAGNRLLVAEFFELLPKIHKGLLPADSVPWERFQLIFLDFRSAECGCLQSRLETRLGNAEGGSRLVTYAVFLEVLCDDKAWARKHEAGALHLVDWVYAHLQNVRAFADCCAIQHRQ